MNKEFTFLFFIIVILSFNFVKGFSVTTLYSDNYPLELKPGEKKTTFFLLRNEVEQDSDLIVMASLMEGEEIASFIDNEREYNVLKGDNVEVPILIKIPKNAKEGDTFRVGVMFKPNPLNFKEGNVQINVNLGKSFPVIVKNKPKKTKGKEGLFSLSLENDEELVETLAPAEKNSFLGGLLVASMFFLIMGIILLLIIVIYVSVSSKRRYEKLLKEQYLMQTQGNIEIN